MKAPHTLRGSAIDTLRPQRPVFGCGKVFQKEKKLREKKGIIACENRKRGEERGGWEEGRKGKIRTDRVDKVIGGKVWRRDL